MLAEVVKHYTLGGQRVAMRQAGTLHYLFTDSLGSSSVTYRSDGGDTITQRYYPWGTIRPGPANTLPTDRTFTGQPLDETIGLLYYSDGAGYGRYYDPAPSRWTQPDPIVPEPSNPQSLNRYSYVFNNPVRYNDPNGRCPWCIAAGIAILKGIDYGWTAWDVYQSSRTLSDPNAADLDRQLAELNVILALSLEAAEPDDVLPVGLPADDVARRGLIRAAREALAAGDEAALRNLPGWMQHIVRGLVTEDRMLAQLGRQGQKRLLKVRLGEEVVKTIPDYVDDMIIGEIKDVAYLSAEKQIQAQVQYALEHGLIYELHIRPDTKLSEGVLKLLRQLDDEGLLNLLRDVPAP